MNQSVSMGTYAIDPMPELQGLNWYEILTGVEKTLVRITARTHVLSLVVIVYPKHRAVRKWWAEYLESMGEWEQAMQFYETAKDYYSLVRILCFNGNIERAVEVAEESGSKAAAYHLARRLSIENGVCSTYLRVLHCMHGLPHR